MIWKTWDMKHILLRTKLCSLRKKMGQIMWKKGKRGMKYHVQTHALVFWKESDLQLDLEKKLFCESRNKLVMYHFFLAKTCQCSSEKMGHVAPLQTVWGPRGTCSTRLDSIKITPQKNQTKKMSKNIFLFAQNRTPFCQPSYSALKCCQSITATMMLKV